MGNKYITVLKCYTAKFMYRDSDGQLRQAEVDISSDTYKEAKLTARNLATQREWRLLEVEAGKRIRQLITCRTKGSLTGCPYSFSGLNTEV